MDCRQAQELLEARLDADATAPLDPTDLRQVEFNAHLAQCDACRALASQLARLDAAFAAARTANDELFAAAPTIRSAPYVARPARARWMRRVKWSTAGLAAAACLTLAVFRPWAPRTTTQHAAKTETQTVNAPARQPDAAGQIDESRTGPAASPAIVRLTGSSRQKLIAIEKDTGVPHVRLVQVYALAPRTTVPSGETDPQT